MVAEGVLTTDKPPVIRLRTESIGQEDRKFPQDGIHKVELHEFKVNNRWLTVYVLGKEGMLTYHLDNLHRLP